MLGRRAVNFRCLSNAVNTNCLQNFGNPSWPETPFGFSSDHLIPFENKAHKNKDISFEFLDEFKVI